jgi:hypothetical protein
MKSYIFWDIMSRSPLKSNQPFGRVCRSACCLLHAAFLYGLVFHPEDGGDVFLRNVGGHLPDYTALYPRRYNSSCFTYVTLISWGSFGNLLAAVCCGYLLYPRKCTGIILAYSVSATVVERSALLLHIREILSSNLCP